MSAALSYRTRACGLTALLLAGGLFASAAWGAVPGSDGETQTPVLLAQATGTTDTGETAEPAPVSSTPDSFTATFGDWQLRCVRNVADPAANAVACEVATTVVAEGQTAPFAQIALSKGADAATHITAVVPVNILVRTAPMVATDEADTGIPVPWLTCTPNGCVADLALADADLERFRAYTKQGRLLFVDSAGNNVTVIFSFRGLSQALDAMAAELTK